MLTNDTRSYILEAPEFLYEPWTNGPAGEYPQYNHRLVRLIAADVVMNAADDLDDEELRHAEALAAEVFDDGDR